MDERSSKYSFWEFSGLILTPLRICTGWLLFSAMWRRAVLKPEALDPLSSIYEGLKFNHFIATSSGIGPMIKFLVLHPELLFIFLWVFTLIEGILGLGLIFGFLTRLAGLGGSLVLLGIMLGAGWLGTTCVDEWQIGIFGIASGLVIFFAGGGPISLDALFWKRANRAVRFLSSGPLFEKNEDQRTYKTIWATSIVIFLFTLITNQHDVGGVWGPFKNPALAPHILLSDATVDPEGHMRFTIYRDGGPDTYGAFITQLSVLDSNQNTLFTLDGNQLGTLPLSQIKNKFALQVKPEGQSLLVPLAGLAEIDLSAPVLTGLSPGHYTLEVMDISNAKWKTRLMIQ